MNQCKVCLHVYHIVTLQGTNERATAILTNISARVHHSAHHPSRQAPI